MARPTRLEVVNMCRQITTFNIIGHIGHTDEQCIQWLQQSGVLPYLNPEIYLCTNNPAHVLSKTIFKTSIIQYRLSCNDCRRNGVTFKLTFTENTWIQRSRLPVPTVVLITYAFIMRWKVEDTANECDVAESTVVDWFAYCREVCSFALENQQLLQVGGNGHVVECDEHHLVSRKFGRGRILQHQEWIWGACDNDAGPNENRLVLARVPTRDKEHLLTLMAATIKQQSIIITDGWFRGDNAQNDIIDIGMAAHFWVNHSVTFSEITQNPFTGDDFTVTTNHIERVWRELDKYIKSYQNEFHIDQYIDQFIYFNNLKGSYGNNSGAKLGHFLFDISRRFSGPTRKANLNYANIQPIIYNEP